MEGLYYLCSKNKGADQLCDYCVADLHLFFEYDKAGFHITRLKEDGFFSADNQCCSQVTLSMLLYSNELMTFTEQINCYYNLFFIANLMQSDLT